MTTSTISNMLQEFSSKIKDFEPDFVAEIGDLMLHRMQTEKVEKDAISLRSAFFGLPVEALVQTDSTLFGKELKAFLVQQFVIRGSNLETVLYKLISNPSEGFADRVLAIAKVSINELLGRSEEMNFAYLSTIYGTFKPVCNLVMFETKESDMDFGISRLDCIARF